MEEKTFVGFNFGRFQNDNGQWQDYCNAFMLEDFSGSESNDYHFGGQKAVKYGCVNPEIYKDIMRIWILHSGVWPRTTML